MRHVWILPSIQQCWKMQQNPSYGDSLGNQYSYFSYDTSDFFSLDSHHMVYFIIWEMHGFPHQFPIEPQNAVKLIVWGEPWELYSYLPHNMGALFSLASRTMVYFITWEMHWLPHQFPIAWEKTAKPIKWGKSGNLVPGNILQNPLCVENMGNWCSYVSHSMGTFFH